MGRTLGPYKAEAFTQITNLLFGPPTPVLRYVARAAPTQRSDDGFFGEAKQRG